MTTTKLAKFELAILAAEAMNLLNDIDREQFTNKQTDAFHRLVGMLPAAVQADFWNNATLWRRSGTTATSLSGRRCWRKDSTHSTNPTRMIR